MDNSKALKEIYNNINNGYCYFEHIEKSDWIKYPYDNEILFVPFFHQDLIAWHNYGSSHNKNTLKDLKFIICELFKMQPTQFIEKYHLKKIYF